MQKQKKYLLGWSRDSKGRIQNWHVVNIANAVTCAKRSNTQNYVLETENTVDKKMLDNLMNFLGK